MAANLNKPGDFLPTHHSKGTVLESLLPPSEFERPIDRTGRQHTAWSSPAEHSECGRQRSSQLQLGGNQVASFPHTKSDYTDEVIKYQATEITELRAELAQCRQASELNGAEWQQKYASLEAERSKEIKLLEERLASAEEDYNTRLSRLMADLDHIVDEKESETSSLKQTQARLEDRVHKLEVDRVQMLREHESIRAQFEADLRSKTELCEEQCHQISGLKTYVCEREEAQKPALAWKLEKEAVDNKLKICQAENLKLSSSLELLEVRFKSISQILAVQEKELGQETKIQKSKNKQASGLLSRWREKVFCLLVQQQSMEILHKKKKHDWKQKIQDMTDELASSQAQVQILQNSLTNKSAQLQMEVLKTQKLEEELAQTQQVAIALDDQSRRDYHSVQSLLEFVQKNQTQTSQMMKLLEEKSASLKSLSQRLHFASNRMDFITTQLVRKSAFSRGTSKDPSQPEPVSSVSQETSKLEPNREENQPLYQEMRKLRQERDSLATQVRTDSEKWSQIVLEAKLEYNTDILAYKKKIEELENKLEEKFEECRQLSEDVDDLRQEVKDKKGVIGQLEADLARHARGIESVLSDQRLKDEAKWGERLADMERKLNASKREHAKTVVSLRQVEQSHQRRLQQQQELLETTETHLTHQLQHLQARLRAVERERNLMMATLRQEGLIDQMSSKRGESILWAGERSQEESGQLHAGSDELENQQAGASLQLQDFGSSRVGVEPASTELSCQTSHQEPVQVVLEELKSLTAAVFAESDDEGDNECQEVAADTDEERR